LPAAAPTASEITAMNVSAMLVDHLRDLE
jgi:hypothetical protein